MPIHSNSLPEIPIKPKGAVKSAPTKRMTRAERRERARRMFTELNLREKEKELERNYQRYQL